MKELLFLVWFFIVFTSPLFRAEGHHSMTGVPLEVSSLDADIKVNTLSSPTAIPALPVVVQEFSRMLGEHNGSDPSKKHKPSFYDSLARFTCNWHHHAGEAQPTTRPGKNQKLFILLRNFRI